MNDLLNRLCHEQQQIDLKWHDFTYEVSFVVSNSSENWKCSISRKLFQSICLTSVPKFMIFLNNFSDTKVFFKPKSRCVKLKLVNVIKLALEDRPNITAKIVR